MALHDTLERSLAPRRCRPAAARARRGAGARLAWAALRLLGGLVVSAAAVAADVGSPAPWTQTLDHALAVADGGDRFPAGATALPVVLPDDLATAAGPSPASGTVAVWYRTRFELSPVDQPLLLSTDRVCRHLLVQLNGETIYRDDVRSASLPCRERRLQLPAALLRDGVNTLDLRVTGELSAFVASRYRAGGLHPLHLTSLSAAEGTGADAPALGYGWRYVVAPVTATALAMLGALMLFVVWPTVGRAHLLYLGLTAVAWAGITALPFLPLTPDLREWWALVLMPWGAAAAVLGLLSFARRRFRWIDGALLAQGLLVPASLVVIGNAHLASLSRGWRAAFTLEVGAAALLVLWGLSRSRNPNTKGVALLLAALGLGAAMELRLPLLDLLPLGLGFTPALMIGAFLVLGLWLAREEFAGLQQAEVEARENLERRVAEATADIERNYATLAELRVEQVTERERKRIASDLHDDLGAKLLTIVHTSESDRISTLAREALEEMRLSVRGLTGRPVRLADALGDWRAEVVSRLGQANIGAEWVAPLEEPPHTLPARAYVQTTRIVREAVSNIIKHSGAARCVISTEVHDTDFVLSIQDNGGGIPMELDGKLDRGHGMASMKQRAKQLQGQCLVESGPGFGTVIRLTIPL